MIVILAGENEPDPFSTIGVFLNLPAVISDCVLRASPDHAADSARHRSW